MIEISVSLQECIDNEIGLMSSLSDALKVEQSILMGGNVTQLADVTQIKSDILKAINAAEVTRNGLLKQSGFSTDVAGVKTWLAGLVEGSPLLLSWRKLIELTTTMNELNKANGGLINKHLSHTQTALGILQQNDQQGDLYGSNGQSALRKIQNKGYVVG
jgi:flagella synthesis protein FlgN